MSLSFETLRWILAAHILGFITWVGGMLGALGLLAGHADAVGETRAVLGRLEKRTAMKMDLGATIAIAAGVLMLIGVTPSPFAERWMQIKLAVAVVLIGLHGLVRVRIKKAGQGDLRPLPAWLQPAVLLVVAALVVLAVVRP